MNNNKIVSTKTTNAIFLAIVLVKATIVLSFSSSFQVALEAHAQPYYGVDNNYKKSKDSDSKSVNINKIKCINDNININGGNVGDFNIGNNGKVANSTEEREYSSVYSSGGYGGEGYNYMKDRGFDCTINNNNPNTNVVVGAGNQTIPEPPIPNPILTVSKEMFICNEPNIILAGTEDQFQLYQISCRVDFDEMIPDPDSPVWIPWDDCIVNNFCPFFDEEDFTMQIEQNPGPNFIRYEFPGTTEGRSVSVESGTYQIREEVNPNNSCINTADYENDQVLILDGSQIPPDVPRANFCFLVEGDCSGTIQAGEEKTCTVKNYLEFGIFAVPIAG